MVPRVEDEALFMELLCRTLSAEPVLEVVEIAEELLKGEKEGR